MNSAHQHQVGPADAGKGRGEPADRRRAGSGTPRGCCRNPHKPLRRSNPREAGRNTAASFAAMKSAGFWSRRLVFLHSAHGAIKSWRTQRCLKHSPGAYSAACHTYGDCSVLGLVFAEESPQPQSFRSTGTKDRSQTCQTWDITLIVALCPHERSSETDRDRLDRPHSPASAPELIVGSSRKLDFEQCRNTRARCVGLKRSFAIFTKVGMPLTQIVVVGRPAREQAGEIGTKVTIQLLSDVFELSLPELKRLPVTLSRASTGVHSA